MIRPQRSALVTGEASDIGGAIARRLADDGCVVIAAGRDVENWNLDGRAILKSPLDAVTLASVEALIASVTERLGGIDLLVQANVIGLHIPFLQMSSAAFQQEAANNLRAAFLVGQAVARHMVARKRGAIVNMADTEGLMPDRGSVAGAALAGGILQLTRIMAVELAPSGVRVNAVATGPIGGRSAMDAMAMARHGNLVDHTSLRRAADTAEIASAVSFLCSDDASFVTGQVLPVDGGLLSGALGRGGSHGPRMQGAVS